MITIKLLEADKYGNARGESIATRYARSWDEVEYYLDELGEVSATGKHPLTIFTVDDVLVSVDDSTGFCIYRWASKGLLQALDGTLLFAS